MVDWTIEKRGAQGLQSAIENQQSATKVTKGTFAISSFRVTLTAMSTGTSRAKFRCAQCEMPEAECECDKYCCLCQTVLEVRICQDGLMYCEPCRNACDYKTSD
jgi:hypothetical protein